MRRLCLLARCLAAVTRVGRCDLDHGRAGRRRLDFGGLAARTARHLPDRRADLRRRQRRARGAVMTEALPRAPTRIDSIGLLFLRDDLDRLGPQLAGDEIRAVGMAAAVVARLDRRRRRRALADLRVRARRTLKVPADQWPRLLVSAALNVTLWMFVMSLALLWLPASEAVVIAYTMPVWTALLAWPLLGERLTTAAHRRARHGVCGPRLAVRRRRHFGKRRETPGHAAGFHRLGRLCRRHHLR